jgi:predicted transcriptional regulator YheO
MNERDLILGQLQQVGEAIVAMFGKNCETCIHDLNDLQNSLVYINGSVTGRRVGAPATDLLVRVLEKADGRPDDMHNYKTVSGDGRILKSSTTFVCDSNNQPIFAFCINFDTTDFFNAGQTLSAFTIKEKTGAARSDPAETFSHSPAETIEALFQQAVLEIGKQPATMSTAEKTDLVAILERSGALQFKGAIEQIALLAGVSKYTIYNYLKKIHARQAVNQM